MDFLTPIPDLDENRWNQNSLKKIATKFDELLKSTEGIFHICYNDRSMVAKGNQRHLNVKFLKSGTFIWLKSEIGLWLDLILE